MPHMTIWRRLMLAAIGIAASAIVLRPELSAALVVRGDDMLYRADSAAALSFYRRAFLLDGNNAVAVDRYVFVSMITHRKRKIEDGITIASRYLAKHAFDPIVVMDRAMCERLLHDDRAAEKDFARVGRTRRDPRALVFAGYAALRRGDRQAALGYWHNALLISRRYVPALRALFIR